MQQPFHKAGLRFECTRCSKCCRHTPGYVFLSPADLARLAKARGISEDEFRAQFCRVVDLGLTKRLSLKEKPNLDCILWEEGGCSMYSARPLQCRAFPFWSAVVASRETWEEQAKSCPGMNQGPVHPAEEIEQWLERRARERFLEG